MEYFPGYVIKIFAESCIEIVHTQKLLLDGIDVNKITQLLVVLMTKLDGKLNPIFNAVIHECEKRLRKGLIHWHF